MWDHTPLFYRVYLHTIHPVYLGGRFSHKDAPNSARTSDLPGADKYLARPGRKQARKHVRDARDFNNIETEAVIKFFSPARQGVEGNSRHSERN